MFSSSSKRRCIMLTVQTYHFDSFVAAMGSRSLCGELHRPLVHRFYSQHETSSLCPHGISQRQNNLHGRDIRQGLKTASQGTLSDNASLIGWPGKIHDWRDPQSSHSRHRSSQGVLVPNDKRRFSTCYRMPLEILKRVSSWWLHSVSCIWCLGKAVWLESSSLSFTSPSISSLSHSMPNIRCFNTIPSSL